MPFLNIKSIESNNINTIIRRKLMSILIKPPEYGDYMSWRARNTMASRVKDLEPETLNLIFATKHPELVKFCWERFTPEQHLELLTHARVVEYMLGYGKNSDFIKEYAVHILSKCESFTGNYNGTIATINEVMGLAFIKLYAHRVDVMYHLMDVNALKLTDQDFIHTAACLIKDGRSLSAAYGIRLMKLYRAGKIKINVLKDIVED